MGITRTKLLHGVSSYDSLNGFWFLLLTGGYAIPFSTECGTDPGCASELLSCNSRKNV